MTRVAMSLKRWQRRTRTLCDPKMQDVNEAEAEAEAEDVHEGEARASFLSLFTLRA